MNSSNRVPKVRLRDEGPQYQFETYPCGEGLMYFYTVILLFVLLTEEVLLEYWLWGTSYHNYLDNKQEGFALEPSTGDGISGPLDFLS